MKRLIKLFLPAKVGVMDNHTVWVYIIPLGQKDHNIAALAPIFPNYIIYGR